MEEREDSRSVAELLSRLANRNAALGQYMDAIKCLTALISLKCLPAEEARARLQLARLLLEHTTNRHEASAELNKAVRAGIFLTIANYRASYNGDLNVVSGDFYTTLSQYSWKLCFYC